MKKYFKACICVLIMFSTICCISACGDKKGDGVKVVEKLTNTQKQQNKKRYVYGPFISIRGEEKNCLYYHRKSHQVVIILNGKGTFDANNYIEDGYYYEFYDGNILQINEQNPGHFSNEETEEVIEEEMNIKIEYIENSAQANKEKYHYIYGPYVSILGEEKNGLFYNKKSRQVVILFDIDFDCSDGVISTVDYLQNGKHCYYINGQIVESDK